MVKVCLPPSQPGTARGGPRARPRAPGSSGAGACPWLKAEARGGVGRNGRHRGVPLIGGRRKLLQRPLQCRDNRAVQIQSWLAARGWQPFDFQREVWQAVAQGRSGMLHATTGSGKTYAVWLGMLAELLRRHPTPPRPASRRPSRCAAIWLTPMRALASDTTRALAEPLRDLAPGWTIGQRTGDTPSAERARQDRRFPTVLVTTPESLSLMLTREHAREELQGIEFVVVDEWHELIGSKRGVQAQLAIARLWRFNPRLVAWGLSATLGNLQRGHGSALPSRARCRSMTPVLVRGKIDKSLVIDTLIPPDPGKYSWAGHLGARMQQPVVDEIARSGTTLVFTNVRSQAEIWYQLLLEARPEWAGEIALHHGSMDKATREWVEQGLKQGSLRAVVATSSLDLGVDFLPVERVLQIGSAKGVARMMQRAGRSGHAPGRRQPADAGAHQHHGDHRGRRGTARGAGRARRSARAARQAAGRAGPASGDGRPGRGLSRRRAVRGGAHRLVVPRTHARGIRLGAGVLRARRRQPHGLSGLPPHRAGRGRRLPRARPRHRQAPSPGHRHHRQRRGHAGEVHERRQHRHHRGGLHRAAAQGRLLLLRRQAARIHPRAATWRPT